MPSTDRITILRDEFDALVRKMQTQKSKKGVHALFAATPTELGAAAVIAAKLKSAKPEPKNRAAKDCVGSSKRRRQVV